MARFLSVGEAARRLCLSADTVRSWFDRGKLKGARSACGRRLVSEDSVEGYEGRQKGSDVTTL